MIRRVIPQPTERQHIGNKINAAMIFAWADLVNMNANSVVDEIDPGQTLLGINILRWWEILRMIETSSSNVDLIRAFVGLIG